MPGGLVEVLTQRTGGVPLFVGAVINRSVDVLAAVLDEAAMSTGLDVLSHLGLADQELTDGRVGYRVTRGTLAIIDVLPPVDPAARARVALYELGLLLRTARGQVHSVGSYEAWAREAGFLDLSTQRLDGPVDVDLMTARVPDGRARGGDRGPRDERGDGAIAPSPVTSPGP